jgi:hypothetical protein
MAAPASIKLPTKNGVSPSTVALPHGPWPLMLDFLAERIPAVPREDWAQRMQAGEVLDALGQPVPPAAPYRSQTRLYYWRALPFEHPVPFEERVVFQDEYLVVADKPHFLPVTPKGRYLQETLLVRLKPSPSSRTRATPTRACSATNSSSRPTRPLRRSTRRCNCHGCTSRGWRPVHTSWPCTRYPARSMRKPILR